MQPANISSTESGTGASTDSVATKETITVNHMPSCACCYGTQYKRYTKTWKNYCPNCGAKMDGGIENG